MKDFCGIHPMFKYLSFEIHVKSENFVKHLFEINTNKKYLLSVTIHHINGFYALIHTMYLYMYRFIYKIFKKTSRTKIDLNIMR